jgi:ferredoxin
MVKVNSKKCIGCGLCVSICPEIFEMDSEGKSKVKKEKNIPCLKEAIESCPMEAIEE